MFNPFQFIKEKFGTPVHRLVRRDDPATSYEAAEKIDTTKMERMVLDAIKRFPNGCISDEVVAEFPFFPYSSVTARFKGLYEKGHIEIIGVRKGKSGRNQRIMRAI
jgi:hypothetical protein